MPLPGAAEVSEQDRRVAVLDAIAVVGDHDAVQLPERPCRKLDINACGIGIKAVPDQLSDSRDGLRLSLAL